MTSMRISSEDRLERQTLDMMIKDVYYKKSNIQYKIQGTSEVKADSGLYIYRLVPNMYNESHTVLIY